METWRISAICQTVVMVCWWSSSFSLFQFHIFHSPMDFLSALFSCERAFNQGKDQRLLVAVMRVGNFLTQRSLEWWLSWRRAEHANYTHPMSSEEEWCRRGLHANSTGFHFSEMTSGTNHLFGPLSMKCLLHFEPENPDWSSVSDNQIECVISFT